MHREAHDRAAQCLACWVSLADGKMRVGVLAIQWNRIVHGGGNACILQIGLQLGAVLDRDRVLRPHRLGALDHQRRAKTIACEPGAVAARDALAQRISSGKIFSFSKRTTAWMVSSREFVPMRTCS